MNDTVTALTKLAEDLTSRVDELEKENASLRAELSTNQKKQASVQQEAVVTGVPAEVVEATLNSMLKAGALTEDQLEESRKCLMNDATAPHRVLQHFLDAQIQAKTASTDSDNLAGGKLSGAIEPKQSAQDACLDRMSRILGMN